MLKNRKSKLKTYWLREQNDDVVIKLILFLLSPILSLLYSLRRINAKSSYIVFFLFALFFGFAFTVDNAYTIDGFQYVQRFYEWGAKSFSDYVKELGAYLTFESDYKDFYRETANFFVTRFTYNYHYLFLFFAFVFAWFQLRSLKFLTDSPSFRTTLYTIILVFLFVAPNQIFNINGARFWTAYWVSVYVLFQLIYFDNKKYWLLLIPLPFFHSSFFIVIILYLLYLLTRNYKSLWLVLFLLSFVFANLSIAFFQDISYLLPGRLQRTVDLYTDMSSIAEAEERQMRFSIVYTLTKNLQLIYTGVLMVLLYFNIKSSSSSKKILHLFVFLMILATFSNFTTPIPSLGSRYLQMLYPFIAFLWFQAIPVGKYRAIIYFAPIALINLMFQFYTHYMMVLPMPDFLMSPFFLLFEHAFV